MARQLRIEYPGAVYHITSRGNGRNLIYSDDEDRNNYLKILHHAVERYRWICHAYCLMGNHYHLLIETPEGNLSKGMRHLNGVYTQCYNRRHRQVGHLFQGRFKAILVEKESYLLELCRYIVRNPVAASMVSSVGDWTWSSYRATAGLAPVPPLLTTDWILGQFAQEKSVAQVRYRSFVADGPLDASPWDALVGRIFLGSDGFIARLDSYLGDRDPLAEIPKVERFASRPDLASLLGRSFRSRSEKDGAICQAYRNHGYTQKQIADFLGVHYATVSRAIRRAERS